MCHTLMFQIKQILILHKDNQRKHKIHFLIDDFIYKGKNVNQTYLILREKYWQPPVLTLSFVVVAQYGVRPRLFCLCSGIIQGYHSCALGSIPGGAGVYITSSGINEELRFSRYYSALFLSYCIHKLGCPHHPTTCLAGGVTTTPHQPSTLKG